MIGISVDTLQNYKKLTELVPELQDWVETGILAPTTAIAMKIWFWYNFLKLDSTVEEKIINLDWRNKYGYKTK